MNIPIISKKLGNIEFLIDDSDFDKLKGWSFYGWTTPRHNGIYVMCYSPDDRRKAKRLHRVLMEAHPGQLVDHINGNPLDNRRINLRIVDSLGNNSNTRKRRNAVDSKYKGVCKAPNGIKWKAQIQYNKKKRALGTYSTEIEAAKAYDKAALEIFGEFANINFK